MVKQSDNSDNSDNSQVTDVPKNVPNPMHQLEAAMCHCKFGRFHFRLLFAALTASFANNILTANTSFLLPNAECDLGMNMSEKGLLNAAPFLGMISSGVFAGFLTDAFGRRKFLIIGYVGVFLSILLEGSSQTYTMLLIGKILEGFCLTIGFNANIAIISELTHKDVRDRVMLLFSTFKCLSLVVVVAKSWYFLTREWHFIFFSGKFELHSWNIYLYSCGIWSLLASTLYYFIPESPKYLLSHGRNVEAMNVLKSIYCENTGKSAESFPEYVYKSFVISKTDKSFKNKEQNVNVCIKSIPTSNLATKESLSTKLQSAVCDMKTLFRKPLSTRLMIFSLMILLNMMAYNTLRLWYPQMSTIIENYYKHNNSTEYVCGMLDLYIVQTTDKLENVTHHVEDEMEICIKRESGSETYINGMIMGFVCLLSHIITGAFMGRISQKYIVVVSLMVCCVCTCSLYYGSTGIQVMGLVSTIVGLTQSSSSLIFIVAVRAFPTNVRTLSVSIITMVGRIGSIIGNLLFPYMLQVSCMASFLIIAVIVFLVGLLAFLMPTPSKDNKDVGDG